MAFLWNKSVVSYAARPTIPAALVRALAAVQTKKKRNIGMSSVSDAKLPKRPERSERRLRAKAEKGNVRPRAMEVRAKTAVPKVKALARTQLRSLQLLTLALTSRMRPLLMQTPQSGFHETASPSIAGQMSGSSMCEISRRRTSKTACNWHMASADAIRRRPKRVFLLSTSRGLTPVRTLICFRRAFCGKGDATYAAVTPWLFAARKAARFR